MNVHSPEDFASVIPYLTIEDGSKATDARIFVNGAMLMLCEKTPETPVGTAAPHSIAGTPVTIRLRLENANAVDKNLERAIAAGAETVQASVHKPWGQRDACLRDPAGDVWTPGGPN